MPYVVRHKATGVILSQYWKGGSYWDGEDDGRDAPRIFTLRGANAFLTQWALGEHRNEVFTSDNPISGHDTWEEHVITDVGRSRSDLEIIKITITYHI